MEKRGEDSEKHWFFYGECDKNHTIELGKITRDGCGEFMPDDSIPDSLLCLACKCHRNYHRKTLYVESNGEGGKNQQRAPEAPPLEMEPVVVPSNDDEGRQQQQDMQMVAAPVAVAEAVEVDELDGRKRPRTMFTDVQKERMRLFAEDLDWKMLRHRNDEINNFCNEIGVSRQSFKVWMHNHKNTSSSSILASLAHAVTSDSSVGRGNIGSSSRSTK